MDHHHRLSPLAFGLAIGIVWAIVVFSAGFTAQPSWGYGVGFVTSLSSIYIGYGPSLEGSFIGALWALIDGLIVGLLIAWVYNFFASCCKSKKTE